MKFKLLGLLILLIFTACSQETNQFIVGEWEAKEEYNNKTNKYVFNINEGILGDLSGSIKTFINNSELPSTDINEIRYSYPEFTFTMYSEKMKILFSGRISNNTLIGKFIYSNPNIYPKPLIFTRM